jgi:hypothetical protein
MSRSYSVSPNALLAQLVEHFHGKEGVIGSSPMEGFIGTPRYGGVFSFSAISSTNPPSVLWGVCGALWGAPAPHNESSLSANPRRAIAPLRDFPRVERALDLVPTPFDDLPPNTVLTCTEIAERIAAGAHSVRRAIRRGELTASRTCGIRVLAQDAATWWRTRLISAPPETAKASEDRRGLTHPSSRPGGVSLGRRFVRDASRLPLPPRSAS